MSRLCSLVAVLAFLAACGEPSAIDPDTGVDTAVPVPTIAIPWLEVRAPPIAPPVLVPCPMGWREVSVDDVSQCEPYPEGGPSTCATGQAHFPGEAECRTVGEACPAGEFADSLPPGADVVYVSASAPSGGDGSLASPFTTLSEVSWPTITAGTILAIGKGRYEGAMPIGAGGGSSGRARPRRSSLGSRRRSLA